MSALDTTIPVTPGPSNDLNGLKQSLTVWTRQASQLFKKVGVFFNASPALPVVLAHGKTPTATGADVFEHIVPFDVTGNAEVFSVNRLWFRVGVAGGAPSLTFEKSTGAGAFSPVTVGKLTLATGTHEISSTGPFGNVKSGDKLRFNVGVLGTATNWTVMAELGPSN